MIDEQETRHEEVVGAVASVVRDTLIEGHRISLPGLGTFHVRHEPSLIEETEDGDSVMIPPRDVVEFIPSTDS